MFLSKIEKTHKIEDIVDIEIVLKGVVRHSGDSTRYYLRFTFKDKEKILFGECMTLRRITDKVFIFLI